MKRDVAEQLAKATRRIDQALHEIHLANERIDDIETQKRIKRAVVGVVCDVYEKITLEFANEYPDLHPDKNT